MRSAKLAAVECGLAIVVGLDPGLNRTGYAAVAVRSRTLQLLEAGVIRVPASLPLPERLRRLHASIGEILQEFKPSVVAVEELYSHYERPRTAILMGHARGVLLLAAGAMGIDVVGYSATRIKKTLTGSGRAGKQQIQKAIQIEFGLIQPIEPPDVADAMAIALCHVHARSPLG